MDKSTNETSLVIAGAGELDEATSNFFKKNASAGTDNISAARMPQLKITEASSENILEGDMLCPAGHFYFSPTREDLGTEVEVSILSISRGFYAMNNDKKNPQAKFNQLMGGIILNTMQPFVVFMGGLRLQNMWDFGKEISPFTKNKERPYPMFSFRVKLNLVREKTDYGITHLIQFNLVKNDAGQIEIIRDNEMLQMLRSGVDKTEELFESFIYQKEVDKVTHKLLREEAEVITPTRAQPVESVATGAAAEDDIPNEPQTHGSLVDVSDDIPF